MTRESERTQNSSGRLSRRAAARAGAAAVAAGVVGAGLGIGAGHAGIGARPSAAAALRTLHIEIDMIAVNGVVFSRDGGVRPPGVPTQQGDHCNVALRVHNLDDTDGAQIGDAYCLGPYLGSTTERGAIGPGFLVTTRFEFSGRGALSGLIYCRGGEWFEGTITGGTGEFFGVRGSFRWLVSATNSPWRVIFDLIPADLG